MLPAHHGCLNMKLCRDCKHWTKPNEYAMYPLERYDYDYNQQPRDGRHQHKVCGLIVLADREKVDDPPKAFTMDASDYHAVLWVAPDFGCVLFEPRDGAP
jgi:hypothetical protein